MSSNPHTISNTLSLSYYYYICTSILEVLSKPAFSQNKKPHYSSLLQLLSRSLCLALSHIILCYENNLAFKGQAEITLLSFFQLFLYIAKSH